MFERPGQAAEDTSRRWLSRENGQADWKARTGDKNEKGLIGAEEKIQIVTLEYNTLCCK